jgi:hypothetical protein
MAAAYRDASALVKLAVSRGGFWLPGKAPTSPEAASVKRLGAGRSCSGRCYLGGARPGCRRKYLPESASSESRAPVVHLSWGHAASRPAVPRSYCMAMAGRIGADLVEIVPCDRRMAAAARSMGYKVSSPTGPHPAELPCSTSALWLNVAYLAVLWTRRSSRDICPGDVGRTARCKIAVQLADALERRGSPNGRLAPAPAAPNRSRPTDATRLVRTSAPGGRKGAARMRDEWSSPAVWSPLCRVEISRATLMSRAVIVSA